MRRVVAWCTPSRTNWGTLSSSPAFSLLTYKVELKKNQPPGGSLNKIMHLKHYVTDHLKSPQQMEGLFLLRLVSLNGKPVKPLGICTQLFKALSYLEWISAIQGIRSSLQFFFIQHSKYFGIFESWEMEMSLLPVLAVLSSSSTLLSYLKQTCSPVPFTLSLWVGEAVRGMQKGASPVQPPWLPSLPRVAQGKCKGQMQNQGGKEWQTGGHISFLPEKVQGQEGCVDERGHTHISYQVFIMAHKALTK